MKIPPRGSKLPQGPFLFKIVLFNVNISEAFWKDRALKRAKRTLGAIILVILIGVVISWVTYRRNPTKVEEIMIRIFSRFCNLCGERPNGAMPGAFRPSFSNQQDTLINETNGDSQITRETYLEPFTIDESGSGVGPTVCVQRTIARQIRSMERLL